VIGLARVLGPRPDASVAPASVPAVAATSAASHTVDRPLSRVPAGTRVVISRILGDEHLRARLFGLGIAPGTALAVAGGGGGRPRLLSLAGSRIALDDRWCELVLVRLDDARRDGVSA
jgi:Fe2+ transport system protein FeoA